MLPPWMMQTNRGRVVALLAACLTSSLLALAPQALHAQRQVRAAAAVQGFDASECRDDCLVDTLSVDVDRARRAQAGTVIATMDMIDTIAIPRRGAPQPPRERVSSAWISCDSVPCAASVITGRITDKRIDDARVVRRTMYAWTLPAPLLSKLQTVQTAGLTVDGRTHALSTSMLVSVRSILESLPRSSALTYSPRALLYIASFVLFGTPGDSTLAEDVGTATEPLMMPDNASGIPTRVATLSLAGRGSAALALLAQDDGTGAAPLFGIGEKVAILLPGAVGRRGIVSGTIAARQRVEKLRASCQQVKLWTYLVALGSAELAAVQRGGTMSPRPREPIDRWSGIAVREPVAARMTPTERRAIVASRPAVSEFGRARAATGLRDRDVQVLAVLPRTGGFVTNFGLLTRSPSSGTWQFPPLSLAPAACP